MDREAIARERRRRQVVEHLEFERDREEALREQLVEVVTEVHGPVVDEQVFAALPEADAALVREVLSGPAEEPDEEFIVDWSPEDEEDEETAVEAELARLQGEIDGSLRRQRAFERYLEALDGPSVPTPVPAAEGPAA
jgi:hypothetical protein